MLLCRVLLNLETSEKVHQQGRVEMCPNDGWVCFRNSTLMCGRLGKKTLGDGNKSGLFHVRCCLLKGFVQKRESASCLPVVATNTLVRPSFDWTGSQSHAMHCIGGLVQRRTCIMLLV